jgi:threonine dehydrogenase-like Zn-dependent dehydrogenase
MPQKMNAIVWDGSSYPGCLSYQQWDIPEPPPGWVLFHTQAVGICGSDLHIVQGEVNWLIPKKNIPAVLGHENAGVVVATGEGVAGLVPGDRVAVEPLHGCMQFGETCPMCAVGKYHICQNGLVHVGVPLKEMLPGGFGEYSIAHSTRCFKIPDSVSLEEAALLDILAVDVHAANLARPGVGTTAAVLGCGVIGLDMIQTLRAWGVTEIIAVAKYPFQGEVARRLGAKEVILMERGVDPAAEALRLTGGWGVDQVYECVGGLTDAVDQATRICHPGGSVLMLGGASGPRPIDLQTMLIREVNIISSMSYATYEGKREFQIAMNMLRDRQVDHLCLITHRFDPGEYRQAFDTAMSKGDERALKVMFTREH